MKTIKQTIGNRCVSRCANQTATGYFNILIRISFRSFKLQITFDIAASRECEEKNWFLMIHSFGCIDLMSLCARRRELSFKSAWLSFCQSLINAHSIEHNEHVLSVSLNLKRVKYVLILWVFDRLFTLFNNHWFTGNKGKWRWIHYIRLKR